MNLGLPRSLGVSAAAHAAFLLLAIWVFPLLAPRMPPIVEISLVGGPAHGPAPSGAKVTPKPGGRKGTAVARTARAAKGSVVVASPEFVPVGKKPRRSGEELMGAGPGDGGAAGPSMGTGPAAGGGGRQVRYAEPLEYPEWAKKEGLNASIIVQIKVYPNGTVDPNITVPKTSGYRDLDLMVIKAIRQYQFEPLPAGVAQVVQMYRLPISFRAE